MCIAIVLMVIGHLGGITWFRLSEWFPMYGYHMALFVFISGYFYTSLSIKDYPGYIWKKTKRLALPLLAWNIVYACITYWISGRGIVDYLPQQNEIFTIHKLLFEPFVTGHQYFFNLATWFMGTLFLAEIVYGLLSYYLDSRRTTGAQMIVYLCIGIMGTCLAKLPISHPLLTCVTKVMYFLFFFHLGRYYRNVWQPKERQMPQYVPVLIMAGLLVVQLGIYHQVGCAAMGSAFGNFRGWIVTPYILGVIGIYFWLRVSSWIEKWIPANPLEDFLSTRTRGIMTHHLLVIFGINIAIIHWFPQRIDEGLFRASMFYYEAIPRIWYIVGAIVVPLCLQYSMDCTVKLANRLTHPTMVNE